MAVIVKKKPNLHLSAILKTLDLSLLYEFFEHNGITVSIIPTAKNETIVKLFKVFSNEHNEELQLAKDILIPVTYECLITGKGVMYTNTDPTPIGFLKAVAEFGDDLNFNGFNSFKYLHGSYYVSLVKAAKNKHSVPLHWDSIAEQYTSYVSNLGVVPTDVGKDDDALLEALGITPQLSELAVISSKSAKQLKQLAEAPKKIADQVKNFLDTQPTVSTALVDILQPTVFDVLKTKAEEAYELNKKPPVAIQKASFLYQLVKGTEKSSVYMVIHIGKKGKLAVASPSAWALKFRAYTNLSTVQNKLEAYGFTLKGNPDGAYSSLHTKATGDDHRDMIIASVMSLFADAENPVVLPNYQDIWKLKLL